MNKEITVFSSESLGLIEWLVDFLGEEKVKRVLAKLERTMSQSSGARLEWGVKGQLAWWISFKRAIEHLDNNEEIDFDKFPEAERPLQTAAELRLIAPHLSEKVASELKGRITKLDDIEPVLIEITTAAMLQNEGYEIDWASSESPGKKIAEFVATRGKQEIEIECKSQTSDAGRMIARSDFHQFVDRVLPLAYSKNLKGQIIVEVERRFSGNQQWQEDLLGAIEKEMREGTHSIQTPDGTKVDLDLSTFDGEEIPLEEMARNFAAINEQHAHLALQSTKEGAWENPIVVQVKSSEPDHFLEETLKDLRYARKQLSRKRQGAIICTIPEIENFEGLDEKSALHQMVKKFFLDFGHESISSVIFVTPPQTVSVSPFSRQATRNSIAFKNPLYNEKYGEPLSIKKLSP
jgi:hypothetical protein